MRGNFERDSATPESDPAFLSRISVNYLRHELCAYEDELAAVFGITGVWDATAHIRRKVYAAISAAYPELSGECDRQLGVRGTDRTTDAKFR